MLETYNLSITELEAGLNYIRQSPKDNGVVKMIVRRPKDDERDVVETAKLDPEIGLIGDNWKTRGSKHSPDGSANINAQVTVMNSRVIELVSQGEERWQLAGDQFFIDMDLSDENIPAGTQLEIGTAVIEVSAEPHTGCKKFAMRYGTDATKFVNSKDGKHLHLRGINAKIIQAGIVHVGDIVRKI